MIGKLYADTPTRPVFKGVKEKNMKSYMKKILRNEQGQGVMEYVIISSLVGIFCLVAVKQFGDTLKTRVNSMKTHIVKNIKIN